MKKAVTAALVLALVLSLGAPAFAAGEVAGPAFNDIAGHEAEADLTLMAAVGIMTGDEGIGGPVRPDDPITRAEFAKMIVGGLGKGATAAGLAGLVPTFADADEIPTWAWGWVNAAYFMGLMRGDDQGKFRADDPINYAEVLTVLVRAVRGHEQQLPEGMWPYNYLFYAVDVGFNGRVDVAFPRLPATRGDVAAMIFAMMQIDRLDADGQPIPGTAMLAGRVHEGLFSDYTATQVTIDGVPYDLAEKVYLVGASDYEGLMNLNVRAVADAEGDIIFIHVIEAADSYSGVFAEYDDSGDVDYLVFEDGTKIAYDAATTVSLNRADAAPGVTLEPGDECLVSLGDDGVAAHVVAYRANIGEDYVTDVVPSDEESDTNITLSGGADYDIPASAMVTINGQAADRDDLAVWDVVTLYTMGADPAGEVIRVEATREVAEGVVTGTKTTYPGPHHFVTIEDASGASTTYEWAMDPAEMPGSGATVKYGLNAAGALFVEIGYEAMTPYVLVESYTVDGEGNKTVMVDSRGQSLTYATTVDFSASIGEFGLATIDGATKVITDFTVMAIDEATDYEVLAVDAANGTMTLKDLGTGAILFVSDAEVTIYEATDGGPAYVGFAGLEAGDILNADATQMIWLVAE
ncbi:MAG TPA: hypothetical protein DGR79_05765 [Clostridiales bacterium]|nr:hypothetical protein [Clostridiales bacterium]